MRVARTPYLDGVSFAADLSLPAVPALGALPDWAALERMPEVALLESCLQEPEWHAEGDVLVHTRMVVDGLVSDPAYAALGADERFELFWGGVLHDIGKPAATVREDGRWRSPHHAAKGAMIARRILWAAGVDAFARERICGLVRHHMAPPRLFERPAVESRRRVIEISLTTGCDRLELLARSDVRGRIADDIPESELGVQLFAAYCEELACLAAPFAFANDHSRFLFFRRPERDPRVEAFDDTRSRAWVMSGLPGAGKDTWIERNLPDVTVISLDALRRRDKVRRGDTKAEGRVIQEAKLTARRLLAAGEPFVWNATNLSKQLRGQVIGLLADYKAHVTVVSVEPDPGTLLAQNRDREHPVSERDVLGLVGRWEPADLTECHALIRVP